MKSEHFKILITSSLLLIITGVVIFFGVYPEMSTFSDNQASLSETRAKLIEADFRLNELNVLSKDQNSIDETKRFVNDLLPDDKNTSDFVVKSEALTDNLSVIIETFTTTASVPTTKKVNPDSEVATTTKETPKKEGGASVDFSITMNESYSTISDVIKKLESFPRMNVLDALYFSNYSTESNTIDFKAQGRVFYGK
jgi:Tfp pilus assembly protein PilO